MNLETLKMSRIGTLISLFCVAGVLGCAPQMPTSGQLAAFHKAGPPVPTVDTDKLVKAKIPSSSYRVITGDLLNIRVPFLNSQSNEVAEHQGTLARRVGLDGKVTLPMIDQIDLAGKTLVECEAAIAAAYYPQHVVNRPAVVVQVVEYDTRYVEVTGGVNQPGRYQLRSSDELSLVSALMRAQNIVPNGAAVIRISRTGEKECPPIVLPVKGLNIPFADVALKGGEMVEVERLNPSTFTVLGLVRAPGTYPFPPEEQITLLQALGAAGGPDQVADPRFVTIYRQNEKGEILSARFQINGKNDKLTKVSILTDVTLSNSGFTKLKPGDVIEVEKDARTRTRVLLSQVLFLRAGATASADAQATYYRDYSKQNSNIIRTTPAAPVIP